MPENLEIAALLLIFLLAGTVKGVIGLGLPTVSLTLVTLLFDLPTAMALMLLPSLLTNIWQAVAGTDTLAVASRLLPHLVTAGATVLIGGILFNLVRVEWMVGLLGLLILTYAILNLGGVRFRTAPQDEKRRGVVAGAMNGVLAGMTGSFVVPGVIYLQSLDMPRQMFVQAMGMLFSISTLALAITLWLNGLLDQSLSGLSLVAVVPALIGMPLGRWLGKHIPDSQFRKLFFGSLAVMGALVLLRAIGV